MTARPPRRPATRCLLYLLGILLLCTCHRHPAQPSDHGKRAIIFHTDGKQPAAGAIISIFDAGSADDRPSFVKITDTDGRFTIDEIPTGIYNLRAEKDSFVVFQDSVMVTNDTAILSDDTLECPSSLSGRVGVKPDHDSRTVTLRLIGAGRSSVVADIGGSFTLSGLASGDYTLQLASRFPDYLPTVRQIHINACSHDTIEDTLRLMTRGAPAVAGITITEDTVGGIVRVSWAKTLHTDFLDYLIYREECSAKDFLHAPLFATTDTSIADSIYFRLPANLADTATRCIRYWIVVRTNNQELGPAYQSSECPFAPKSSIMISPSHKVWNHVQPKGDSASINDTMVLSLNAKNRTRPVRTIIWYDPVKHDTISRAHNNDSLGRSFSDTIRYVFGTVGINTVLAVALDNAGARTIDTVPVKIVPDIPVADAGHDTGVFVGEKAFLHGSATQQFGSIVTWKWKIGSGVWNSTSGSDTVIEAPSLPGYFTCQFSATDEDRNTDTDAMTVLFALRVTAVAAGNNHSVILKSDGTAWGCGDGANGRLGNQGRTTTSEPVQIMTDVRGIAAGGRHSLFLRNDHTLWGCGSNECGQLGDGTITDRYAPVKIMDNVQTMAAGTGHTMILGLDGSLWTCGINDSGQLGDGTDTSRWTPVKIMTDVKAIAAGGRHSLILKNDGTLWACGKNHSGQLGDETEIDKRSPTLVYRDVQSMSAGDRHSLICKNDGSVWSSGNNWYGQLGDSTGGRRLKPEQVLTGIRSVAAGKGFSHFIAAGGTLLVCGLNESGQAGGGEPDTLSRPVRLLENVATSAAGESHSLILKSDGSLWVCGDNSSGQLGDGTTTACLTPKRIIPYMWYTSERAPQK